MHWRSENIQGSGGIRMHRNGFAVFFVFFLKIQGEIQLAFIVYRLVWFHSWLFWSSPPHCLPFGPWALSLAGYGHWLTVVIFRERQFGFHGVTLLWFRSYLSGRSYSVWFADEASRTVHVICSVPQGSVHGPRLFIIYSVDLADQAVEHDVNFHGYADDTQLLCSLSTWGNRPNYCQTGTLHHRHGQLDVCEQAQVKYGEDGAAVGWNKIRHVNVEWLRSLSTAQQRHCQGKSTCMRARSPIFLRIWVWTNTFPVSVWPAFIIFVNSDASGVRLMLVQQQHSFTPSWRRVFVIAMQSSPRLRRQQQTGYNMY